MALDVDYVRKRLPGRVVSYFPRIDSTMPEAARLAAAGCGPGTIVVADEQTAGQGRYGRYWHSEAESGLYASIVLRPALSSSSLPVLMLALGLATAEAIARATNLGCDIRWPNDVLINDKKVAEGEGIRYPRQAPLLKDTGLRGYEPRVRQTCQPKKSHVAGSWRRQRRSGTESYLGYACVWGTRWPG